MEASPKKDGIGIVLYITEGEKRHIETLQRLEIGQLIASMVTEAYKRRTGKEPTYFFYTYYNLRFSTEEPKS